MSAKATSTLRCSKARGRRRRRPPPVTREPRSPASTTPPPRSQSRAAESSSARSSSRCPRRRRSPAPRPSRRHTPVRRPPAGSPAQALQRGELHHDPRGRPDLPVDPLQPRQSPHPAFGLLEEDPAAGRLLRAVFERQPLPRPHQPRAVGQLQALESEPLGDQALRPRETERRGIGQDPRIIGLSGET